MPKLYSEQFKADAVALVDSGMSRRRVCADLGISRSSLQKWITDARLKAHGMSPSNDPEVAKEMSAALKRIRELEARKRSLARRSCLFDSGRDPPKRIFPTVETLITQGKATLMIAARVVKFSRQAFYKWVHNKVSAREKDEAEICQVIRQIHDEDPEFGYRLIADELADGGYRLSERRVWRVCHTMGIASVISRRKSRTKKAGDPVHDDFLQRHFRAEAPNTAWVTDITEHWTGEGKLYLCAIKDLCSRRIVGYVTSSRMKASLAVAALEDAMARGANPRGVIVHSDRGSQFRSRKFRAALTAYGAKGSMGKVGACGDNAAMESFFALVQNNVLDRKSWASRRELSAALTHWIERTYHRKRRQRALGKLIPIEFETIMEPAVSLAA